MNGDGHTICQCNLEEEEKDNEKCEPKATKCNCDGNCMDNICNGHGKCLRLPGDEEKRCFCQMSYSGEFCEARKTCVKDKNRIRKFRLTDFKSFFV